MKKLLFISTILLLTIYGCSPAELEKFEYGNKLSEAPKNQVTSVKEIMRKTEPRFIDNLLNSIEIPSNLTSYLSLKDKIVISSIDRNYHSDNDCQVAVDRALIKKLLKDGYYVLDRDDNILLAATAENSKSSNNIISLYKNSIMDSVFNTTNLPIAYGNKILSYRILELGVLKMKLPNTAETKRIGNAEIEFRIIDASTTQILAADLVQGYYEDIILDDELNFITNLHYKFDGDAYPLLDSTKSKSNIELLNKSINNNIKTTYKNIPLSFKRGAESTVQIKSALSGQTIKSFAIPEESASQKGYKFEWDVENLQAGKYDIFINGKFESTIDL